jgi:AsmA protein
MRFLVRLIGFLVVLVLVAAVGLLMLPGDRIARVAVDQIKAQTGREVTLLGDTTISYYPVLGVSTGPITISNAPWSKQGPLMQASALKVGVDLMSLLSGDVRITGLEAVAPDILLERAANGRVNWDTAVSGVAPSGQPAGGTNPLALSLDRALITGGKLRYVDHATGMDVTVRAVGVDLRWPAYKGLGSFDLTMTYGAAPLRLSGEVGNLGDFLEGAITPLSATLSTAGGEVRFEGRGAPQPQLQGRLSADITDSAQFAAALGLEMAELPKGLGHQISLGADLTLTKAQMLSVREMQTALDHNDLAGEMDLDLSQSPPYLTARLSAGAVDLSGLGANSSGGTAAAQQMGWSKAPINAGALSLMNGKVAFETRSLSIAGFRFGAVRTQTTIDRARAVVQLKELAGYNGMINGELVFNNRSGLSVGGELSASGLELQTLLADMVGITRFTGQAVGQLSYLGVGNSVHSIMNSLSGAGQISMGRGTIQGIDLDKLMRSGVSTGGTTVFDRLSASFTMRGGDLFNSDLLLQLPALSASGEGRIGLGARDLDYLFTPQIKSIDGGKGLAIPVRIRGPWSAPRVRPDMEKAIDLNFKEEKDNARQKLEQEITDRLGVEKNEGESTEDAIKRQLEDEVKDKLKGLLR